MYLFYAAIGSIIGSLIFVLGDHRVLVTAIISAIISATAFTKYVKYKDQILTLLSFVLIMFFNYNIRAEHLQYLDLNKYIQAEQNLSFTIVKPVKKKLNFNDEFIVEIKSKSPGKSIITSIREIFAPYRFLAYAKSNLGLSQGDILEINSKTRNEFSFEKLSYYKAKALKKDKVFFRLKNSNISYLAKSPRPFSDLREEIKRFFYANLNKDKADICSSLLFGSRITKISDKISKQIRQLGLGHFFAASGFHLVVLVAFLNFIFAQIQRFYKVPQLLISSLSIAVAFIYSGLAGFSPSIVRALICVTMYFLAELNKRKLESIKLLFLLAGIVIFIDPYTIFDLGFQFSYLATLSLLIWAQHISKAFIKKNFITETLSVSLSVQFFLAPVCIYYFGTFPFWGIVANLVFTPILSLVIVSSFLGLTFLISPLLDFVLLLFNLSSGLPFINNRLEMSFPALIILFITLNLIAFHFAYPSLKDKFPKLKFGFMKNIYLQRVLIFSFAIIFFAKTLPLYKTYAIELNYKKFTENIAKEIHSSHEKQENYKYFEVHGLKTLLINDLSSLKKLGDLKDNLQEIHLLVLSKLDANDIYLNTLIKLLKPQFVLVRTSSKSKKVGENLELLAKNSNLIVNEGKLIVSDSKYWRIYQ